MEVILLKDMGSLGDKHEVAKVKPGYGRNFLIPQGLAIIANAPNMKKLDEIISKEKAAEEARVDEFKAMSAKINGQTLKIGVKAGTSGKIFGSVTSVQIAAALKDQLDLDIERKKIHLPEEVKEVGSYTADLHLHKELTTKIAFELIAE